MNSEAASDNNELRAPEYILENFEASDRIAILLRDSKRAETIQRITTAENAASLTFQAWLRHKNLTSDVYIGMNTLKRDAQSRTKEGTGRKSMSRRSGQNGCIQEDGNWYVVRFWKDVAGQEKRQRAREKICPLSGPGSLSASERKRRAKEIITASGADSVEHFNKVVQSLYGVTFREQAAIWLDQIRSRKRKPVAPATIETWESALDNWVNPNLGDMPLDCVNNTAMKQIVAKMIAGGLAPKSISNYTQIVKMVVASAVDENGEELYPRKWNHQFIDLPVVKKQEQQRPSFTGDVVTEIIAATKREKYRVLFVLCAAAGLRIGEALGIDIQNISPRLRQNQDQAEGMEIAPS